MSAPSDGMHAAHAKRRSMRTGGRSVGYDGIVITPFGGRYQVRVRDPYRHRYVCAYADSRKEAEAWGKSKRADLVGRRTTSEDRRLSDAAAAYLRDLRTAGASRSSMRIVALACAKAVHSGFDDLLAPKYRQRLQEWLGKLGADQVVDPGIRQLMHTWLPELAQDVQGEPKARRQRHLDLSASSRNTYLRCIRTVVKMAARDGEFADPLAGARGFKVEKTIKPVFTPPELRQLLAEAQRQHPAWLGCALLLYTGCRIDEGLHLRWRDIDFAGGSVTVHLDTGAAVKGLKERTFPLQTELRDILEEEGRRRWGDLWRQRAHGFIIADERFRRRKADGTLDRFFYGAMQSLCTAAGLPTVERRSPHSFRHTHAALRVATGESPFRVQGDLGHEADTMTRHYSREERHLRGHVKNWPADGQLYIQREPPVAMRGEPAATGRIDRG